LARLHNPERFLTQEECGLRLNPIDMVSNWRRRIKHLDGIAKVIWDHHAAKTPHKMKILLL
jgi:hypothetical protein